MDLGRRVAGELPLVRPARGRRGGDEVVAGLAERGVLVRAGGALGRDGRAARDLRDAAENRRFLDALADGLSLLRAALCLAALASAAPALAAPPPLGHAGRWITDAARAGW